MSHPQTTSAPGFEPADGSRPLGQGRLQLRALVAALMVVGLVVLGFVVGLASGVRDTDLTMLALALGTFAVACVPLVLDQARPPVARHVFLSIVAMIYIIHFVVPALTLYIPAVGPIDASSTSNTDLLPPHVVAGQVMALLGLVSMLGAYALPIAPVIAGALPEPRVDWSLPTLIVTSLVMMGLGWLTWLMGVFGLIPLVAGSGVIGVIASGRSYATVLLTYAYLQHRSRMAAALIAVNVVLLFLMGLVTSDKKDMLIGPALVVLTSTVLTKRLRARWVVAGFVGVALVYPISGFLREQVLGTISVAELITNPAFTISLIGRFLTSGQIGEYLLTGFEATGRRIDGLGIASVIVRDTPSASPFQYGRTLWLFFAAFVPRILWPDKPNIQIGQWITDVYGSGPHIDANTAPTPIGEFYLNFGVIGVVMGMALIGFALRLAHEALNRRGISAPSVLAQVAVLVIMGLRFAGAVAGVYSQVVFTLVPLVLIHLFVRTFTRTIPLLRGGATAARDAPRP